jgi:hypothetical protein
MLQINPALRLADVENLIPMRRAEDAARWVNGLRKAGVPE